MLGDDELVAVGITLIFWVATLGAALLQRRRVALALTVLAGIATIVMLVLLRAGTGHRA